VVSVEQASTAALLTIFVFGGYEVLTVPAGESKDPRRHVPFALITTVVVVGAVTSLCQIVAVGTLDNLAASTTPLADAAAGFLGSPGALLIAIGALASMTGNLAGQILTGSRMLFALAEQGDLPRALARIHPRFRTPANAVLFTAVVALALALTLSFASKYSSMLRGFGLFHSQAEADTREQKANRDRTIAIIRENRFNFLSQFILIYLPYITERNSQRRSQVQTEAEKITPKADSID